jgi:serine/threonine protein kinase
LRQAYLETTPMCLEYEFVNGGDLAALLTEWQRGGAVPRRQINVLMHRLAEIVGHAHRLTPAVVHRDLKPANILIERSDGKTRLRVTDFGIGGVAASRQLESTKRGSSAHGLNLATSLRGAHTPNYASPQQVRGEAPDPRDDVHALGVIWYQLLTGDLATGIPADWSTELKDLGQEEALITLLGQCVTSKTEKRLADARALAERLDAVLNPRPVVVDVVPVAEKEPEVVLVAELAEPPRPAKPTQGPRAPVTQRPSRRSEDDDVPTAELDEPRRPPRAPVTQRQPQQRPVTQREPAPERTEKARPSQDRTEKARPSQDRTEKGRASQEGRPPAPQPGNQFRRFYAPGMSVADLTRELQDWLKSESFDCQDLKTEQGGTLIQVRQQGGWRAFVGMQTALNVILYRDGDEITVEIGAGQWLDKAAAGVVSLFVLWPLAVTAAIGAWNQMKMPERVFGRVNEVVGRRPARPTAVLPPEIIAQLRELAQLRDEGIITDEEFQARKARLLE